MFTTRLTPLNWTVTLRVSVVVLLWALDAVTVTAQRPVVSSTAVLNVPPSATGTVSALGGWGGRARRPAHCRAGRALNRRPGRGRLRSSGRRRPDGWEALIVTDVALVVLPWTGMAPFSTVVPSVGWSTVRVGAWTTENGTVMKTRAG